MLLRLCCYLGAEIDCAIDRLGLDHKVRALRLEWRNSEEFADRHCWLAAMELDYGPLRPDAGFWKRTTLRIYSREPHAQNPV